jgi:hypothetical protein
VIHVDCVMIQVDPAAVQVEVEVMQVHLLKAQAVYPFRISSISWRIKWYEEVFSVVLGRGPRNKSGDEYFNQTIALQP